jgi:hypothetical protein
MIDEIGLPDKGTHPNNIAIFGRQPPLVAQSVCQKIGQIAQKPMPFRAGGSFVHAPDLTLIQSGGKRRSTVSNQQNPVYPVHPCFALLNMDGQDKAPFTAFPQNEAILDRRFRVDIRPFSAIIRRHEYRYRSVRQPR